MTNLKQYGLKQLLVEAQDLVDKKEKEYSKESKFRGAGVIRVTVPKTIGKALGLEQDYVQSNSKKDYVIGTVSSNGAIDYAEDLVQDIIKECEVEAHPHTYLT